MARTVVFRSCFARALASIFPRSYIRRFARCVPIQQSSRFRVQSRGFQSTNTPARIPDFAFVFDIDGVLVRGQKALPKAGETLTFLKEQCIPFLLLTNGGGYHEEKRATKLTQEIGVPIDARMIVQSHTPFANLEVYKEGTALIIGGERDSCRQVAELYGFRNTVTTSDLFSKYPEIWPFSRPFLAYHQEHCRPLPQGLDLRKGSSDGLCIDSIFVYNDPRDWGLDIAVIIDCLLSNQGRIGTVSEKNGNPALPNRGYQQEDQPPLFFSNPDLWFAAEFVLPRLGQGGFKAALEGVWAEVTGGKEAGVELCKRVFGKPYQETYEFAEKKLMDHREIMFGKKAKEVPLKQVFMVGDNPDSDIRGTNSYRSPCDTVWNSVLVRTGVFAGAKPAWQPKSILNDVNDAVQWAVVQSKWDWSNK